MTKKGLGKGLDALFDSYEENEPQTNDDNKDSVIMIDINKIDPNINQPRKSFDKEKINKLAESIKRHGIIQPIVLKKENKRFVIIAGERRWRAAIIADKKTVPAVIKDVNERELMELALIENLQREDLNAIEEAKGIKNLIEKFNMTQEKVAEILGRSRPAIANSLRLLNLTDKVQQYIIDEKITAGHARALITIKEPELMNNIVDQIVTKNLTVRETEKLINKIKNKKNSQVKETEKPNYLTVLESTLEEYFGTKVMIKTGKSKSLIEIEYYNDEDLERIMELVMNQ